MKILGINQKLSPIKNNNHESFNDLTLSYTNSDTERSQDLKSEYVPIEEQKNPDWNSPSDETSGADKEIAQESNYLNITSPYGPEQCLSGRTNQGKILNTDES